MKVRNKNAYEEYIKINKQNSEKYFDWNSKTWGSGVNFGKHRLIVNDNANKVMCKNLSDLAKAVIFSESYPNSIKSKTYLVVFKLIEVAFVRMKIKPCIFNMNKSVLEKVVVLAENNYSLNQACRIERYLKKITTLLITIGILPNSLSFFDLRLTYPTYMSSRENNSDDEESKLPNENVLLRIATVFSRNDLEDRDIFITSIVALLMCAPVRISEVLDLNVDCEVKENEHYGIRYNCGKDFGHTIKWIPKPMQPVAELAIKRLQALSEPARSLAALVENGEEDFYKIIGLTPDQNVNVSTLQKFFLFDNSYLYSVKSRNIISNISKNHFKARDLWAVIVSGFPTRNVWHKSDSITYRNKLLLINKDQLHGRKKRDIFSFYLATEKMFTADFRNSASRENRFFTRNNLLCDNNTQVFRSHSARHLLNTISQRSFLSDYEIAQWSGRSDIRQNKTYDNRSGEEVRDNDRKILLAEETYFETKSISLSTKLLNHKNNIVDLLSSLKVDDHIRTDLICFIEDLEVLIDYFNGEVNNE